MRITSFREFNATDRRWLAIFSFGLILILGGCATPTTTDGARKPGEATHAPGAARAPEFSVSAPLAAALSSVKLEGSDYFAVLQKATFTYTIGANGIAKLSLREGGEVDPLELGDRHERKCTERGSALNDQTVDYPYAAILTRGAALTSVRVPRVSAPLVMLTLSQGEVPTQALYTGPGRHAREYSYDTCVGPNRADGYGHRLLTFMPSDATLSLQSSKTKQSFELKFDGGFAPFVFFRYSDGKTTAAPSRIVLATIDEERRRINLHYRTLFRPQPNLQSAELRAVIPPEFGGRPDAGETAGQFRDRSERWLVHLANCEMPTKYGEVCAEPSRALP